MENKITFEPNYKKAIEVILWFCCQKKGSVNLYNLLKSLFYAEVDHLNKFGRPIIGDTYMAMPYGTVPSLVLDLINENKLALTKYEIKSLPFKREKNSVKCERKFDAKYFSKSDLSCLEKSFEKYGNKSFKELKDLNHEHPAWKQTRKESPNSPIPFELLVKDKELVEELREVSKDMVV